MKKTTLFSLLTMLFLFIGSNVWADDSWVKTSPTQLQTGDVVVIADLTTGLAMSNSEKNTKGAPLAKPISINTAQTQIAETVAASLQWVVTVEDGTYKFNVVDTENYLYCISDNNGLRIGSSNDNVFSLKQDANGTDFLFNEAQSRYIGPYNSTDWRSYTSINNNIKDAVTVFFKLTSGGTSGQTTPTLNWLDEAGASVEKLTVSLNGTVGVTFSTNSDGGVTYESSDETVATIDAAGNISPVGLGTAVITAKVAETSSYWAGSKSFTLTVVNDGGGNVGYVWVRTAPEDLASGDIVVIADLTKSLVMSNNNGASAAPTAIAVTFSDDDKTEIADDDVDAIWQWVMEVDATTSSKVYKFKVNGTSNYLYCISNNNGVRVGTGEANAFSIKDDFLYNDGQGRYIGPYQTQDWRCYTSINNNILGTQIAFFKKVVGTSTVTVNRPVISPDGGTFSEAQTVTITADEGCTIYYTLDGTTPTNESNLYEAPFTVNENCTVKAVAYDDDDNVSATASAEFTFMTPMTTIAELCAATPTEDNVNVEVLVEFNNWIVTGVKNSNVYFTDGANGILLYQSGHNFVLGNVLTGSAVVTLTKYNEAPEIKGLKSTTEGVTVTDGEGATPRTDVAISDLKKDMQGCLITLEGVTYSEGVFVDDDDNPITPYSTFVTLPTLMEGKTYNVTGVVIWYNSGNVWEIAPRTADEIVLVTTQIAPTSSWNVEELVVDINDEVNAVFTTNSDGAVTYASSDEDVATISPAGVITLVGKGVTTITANVAESETYLPDSKSFVLTVTKDGYASATFAYTDSDILGQGASGGGDGASFSATRNGVLTLSFTNAYGTSSHIKVYGNGTQDIEYSNVELSVVEGYAISQIVFTITGSQDYRSIWVDQFGAEPVYSEDSLTVTWAGMQNRVILNNLMNTKTHKPKQAQIRTIDVTYIKLQDTGNTVTISDAGVATFCSDAKVVLSGAEQFAIAGAITDVEAYLLKVDTLTSSIPANEGVLLMGAPGIYKVYTHPDLEENAPKTNLLVGVLEETAAPVGSYVLQNQDAVGFFEVVASAPITIPAGHAYLNVPSVSAGAPAFYFTQEDYETVINKVEVVSENGAIYNLAGQRLNKMQKGINIVNGKKILK